MAFPTSGLSNNQVHKEGNRAFVYDSTLDVWDQVRETDRTENKILSGELGSAVTGNPTLNLTHATFPAGHIIQTVQSSYITEWEQTMNGSVPEYANNGTEDLNVAITPSSASNKIFLTFSIGANSAHNAGTGYGLGVIVTRNGTSISVNVGSSNHPKVSFVMSTNQHSYSGRVATYHFLDSPGIITECVYKLKCISHSSSDHVTRWNRQTNLGTNAASGHASVTATNFIAQEVQG